MGRRCRPTRRSISNRDFGQIAREILQEAAETDRREDELYGRERGDELPEHLRTREGRRKALREAKLRERNQSTAPQSVDDEDLPALDLDLERFVTRPEGRRAWLREGRRALDAKRRHEARPIARDRTDRLFEACRRLEKELDFDRAANAAYEAWRARGIAADGTRRMAPGMVKPYAPPAAPGGLVSTTDHDSRVVRTHGQPPLQGYNAQMTRKRATPSVWSPESRPASVFTVRTIISDVPFRMCASRWMVGPRVVV
jgi:hypothetical protein